MQIDKCIGHIALWENGYECGDCIDNSFKTTFYKHMTKSASKVQLKNYNQVQFIRLIINKVPMVGHSLISNYDIKDPPPLGSAAIRAIMTDK